MKDDPQSETREVFGWHFIPSDRRLANGDGRLVVDGETLSVDGEVVMCRNGLHLSERAVDAFRYGRLPVVCRVAGSGYSQRGSDKAVFRSRRCVWSADATQVLVRFAAWCADRAKKYADAATGAADAAAAAAYAAASPYVAADADAAAYAAAAGADAADAAAAAGAASYAEREAQNEWLTEALWELAPAGFGRAIT